MPRTTRTAQNSGGAVLALLFTLGASPPATALAPAGLAVAAPPVTALAPAVPNADVLQDPAEAVMVAAGTWALNRLPQGTTRLDPHRSGAGKDAARVQRVARALRADLGTLEEMRRCEDVLDRSTCRLDCDRLLAITAPRIDGDRAQVRVYAWTRSDASGAPVAQRSWDLVLQRQGGSWTVVSGG